MMNKKILLLISVIIFSLFITFGVKKFTDNIISRKIQNIQELKAKEIADYKLKCETEKLTEENELKKKNEELLHELEKAKILIEKMKKQNQYNNMIKTDLNGFMKELDATLGIKGKQNEK